MNAQVRIIDYSNVTPEVAMEIARLSEEVWPGDGSDLAEDARRRYEMIRVRETPDERSPRVFGFWLDGTLIAKSDTFLRRIKTGVGEIPVMALAGVCVRPSLQGKGYGAAVVRVAIARVDRQEFPVGLWQTSPRVRPFYEKLGAVMVNNRFVNLQNEADPEKTPWWDDVIMRYPATAPWPDGTIDLNGSGY